MAINDVNDPVAVIARIDAVPTILEVVCRTTGMGCAVIARVTPERWVACGLRDESAFGLKAGDEFHAEATICREVGVTGEPVIIEHVAENHAFFDHPAPAVLGFQSYIATPIRHSDGTIFGTLCAFDPRPMTLNTPETIGLFTLFADLIAFHLEAQEKLALSEATLLDVRATAELREQFVAVLGHDLRNPLASIDAGVKLLGKAPDDKAAPILALMQNSVRRMAGLIDNVMDFARARLGGGFALERDAAQPLGPVLDQVIAELAAAWPERRIEAQIALPDPVDCDRVRVAQMFSNLLANALAHGAASQPVTVRASSEAGLFELSVANAGEPIPQAMIDRLFEPFFRASVRPSHQGLGLGLYIAAEIARAHGGTLAVASDAHETRFTFTMPVRQAGMAFEAAPPANLPGVPADRRPTGSAG